MGLFVMGLALVASSVCTAVTDPVDGPCHLREADMIIRWFLGRGWLLALAVPVSSPAQTLPIIDMHMHAYSADAQGPPPVVVCAPYEEMPLRDPLVSDERYAADTFKAAHCRHPIRSGRTDDEVREQSLATLKRLNITAVVGGPLVER